MKSNKSNPPRRRAMRLRGYDYSQPGAYFVTICAQHRKCLFGTITDGKMQLNEIGQIVIECWNRISQHFPSVELGEYVVMPNHAHGIIRLGIPETKSPHVPEHVATRRGEVSSPALDQDHKDEVSSPTKNNTRRGEVSSPALNNNRKDEVSSPTKNNTRRGEVSSPALNNNRKDEVSSPTKNNTRRGEVSSPALNNNRKDEGTSPTRNNNRRGEVSSPTLGKIIAYFKYQSTKRINQHRDMQGTRIWQRDYYDHVVRDDPDLQRLRQYIQNNPMKWELDQLHPNNLSRW